MASYTPSGDIDSVNAMGNITNQTGLQRERFGRNNTGAASQANIFIHDKKPTPDSVRSVSYNKHLDMYEANVYTGTGEYNNPDFGVNSLILHQLGYDGIKEFVPGVDDSKEDKPKLGSGPNLRSGLISSDGSPTYTQTGFSNSDETDSGDNGFGMSVTTNDIENATVGSYLRRKWDASTDLGLAVSNARRPQLGEAIDHDNLSYSGE